LELGTRFGNREEDHMPLAHFIRESQPLSKPEHNHADHADKERSQGSITGSSFVTVVALSLIGLLIFLIVISLFPDLGAVIAEYNQF
jgi:hypothetical protein